MKNGKKSEDTITFRLEEAMETQWGQALKATGLKDGELVRECIRDGFSTAVKRVIRDRENAKKKMVRDTGFEPVTPTVSTWGSPELCLS